MITRSAQETARFYYTIISHHFHKVRVQLVLVLVFSILLHPTYNGIGIIQIQHTRTTQKLSVRVTVHMVPGTSYENYYLRVQYLSYIWERSCIY